MRVISYSVASKNLSVTLRQIIEDHAAVLIVHQSGESCVLMSLEEYNSLGETAYLMRSPTNAKRLMNAIESFKAGG
jgi:antitoxin YefM